MKQNWKYNTTTKKTREKTTERPNKEGLEGLALSFPLSPPQWNWIGFLCAENDWEEIGIGISFLCKTANGTSGE